MVGANVTGVPDISLFPQLLIKRVDVVTGGASASYGSDAVGGVVNFITDKHFEGFKANVQGGITTYGDDKQVLFQVAVGQASSTIGCTSRSAANMTMRTASPPAASARNAPGGRDWYRTTTLRQSRHHQRRIAAISRAAITRRPINTPNTA